MKITWDDFFVLFLVAETIIFMLSIMGIDESLSAIQSGNIFFQNLLFSYIEPRVVYHTALLFLIFSWLTLALACAILWRKAKGKSNPSYLNSKK